MLLPTALKKSWIYKVLPFIESRNSSPMNKVPDREFYWSAYHEFYTRLGIWNCRSVWSTDKFMRKLILLRENESSLEKKQFYWKIFFQASRNPARKRKVSKTEVMLQSLAIKWISFKFSWRFRNVNIGGSFSLINKNNITVTYVRWEVKFSGGKKFMNGKNFLLKVIWFFEWCSHVISHYPVKFGVHRTCEIGVRTFFICHETTYNHVIKESCNFVHIGPIPLAITLSSLVVMRHV